MLATIDAVREYIVREGTWQYVDAYAYCASGASRRVCCTLFVRHVLTRCFRFNFLLRQRSPSLCFLDWSLHKPALKSLLGLINILNSHNFYLSTSPARRVYRSSTPKRLRTALAFTCIIAPLLSEHNQGLGRIRCSVLLIALASIYYMRALVYSPHDPCSIGFPRFLSACCTLLWVVDSVGNCIHRRKRW